MQDVRFALRMLARNPGFTAVAVASLAIGIGANSAIFSLADAVLLRPLAIEVPEEIVTVRGKSPHEALGDISYRDYVDLRDHNRSFTGMLAFADTRLGFAAEKEDIPQLRLGLLVSGNFFEVLGVRPQAGRSFRADEDWVPGRDAVAILGHDLWMERFNGDANVVGRSILLNGLPFTIVGVAPERFNGTDQFMRAALYVPIAMAPSLGGVRREKILERRDARNFAVKARLKPGVSVEQAEQDLTAIARGLASSFPDTNRDQGVTVRTELRHRIERSTVDAALIALLGGLSCVVLLIACANVANLLLSRSAARSREMAVRLAIGAGRVRLLRQLLTESILIALAGGLAGLGIAYAGVRYFGQIQLPTDLPMKVSVQLDARVLVWCAIASLASALLFGLAPAWQATRGEMAPALKSDGRAGTESRRFFGRNALVVAQVAMSLALLAAAAMLYRGFGALLLGSPGFRTDHLVTMTFDPTLVRYTREQTESFFEQLRERAKEAPGVKNVTLASTIPMSMSQRALPLVPEGYQFPQGRTSVSPLMATVDEAYFDVIGVPILRGRGFTSHDDRKAPRVAVVNEVFAERYWPGGDALGKRFRLVDEGEPVQVVGIAKNSKYQWISEPPTPFFYLPVKQDRRPRMTLIAESFGDPAALVQPLRQALSRIDPNQPIYDVRTMADFHERRTLSIGRLLMQIVGMAGFMGLALALVGLYGLIAYSVSRRTREIGIRMAVGAERRDVLRMVLRQGLLLAGTGIALGFIATFGVGRLMHSVFMIAPVDPVTLAVVPLLLLAVSLAAAFIPARRASRVDPLTALRYE